jgi:tRNA(Ile)-lysidine synthase
LIAAHFNHRLRGAESDEDARFVQTTAEGLGVQFALGVAETPRPDEASARRARFEFLLNTARQSGARYIALGQSTDDNVETVLHDLFRGTGPRGLAGIAPFRPFGTDAASRDFVLVRPMLAIRREQIRSALQCRKLPWREDPSNQSLHYQRNWLRHRLIPDLQTEFPDVVDAVARAIANQRQWAKLLDRLSDDWIDCYLVDQQPLTLLRLDRPSGKTARPRLDSILTDQAITVEALRKLWLRNRWPLQAISQSHWNRLHNALHGDGDASFYLPGSIEVARDERHVIATRT